MSPKGAPPALSHDEDDIGPEAVYCVSIVKVPPILFLTTLPLLAGLPPTRGEAAVALPAWPAAQASLPPSRTNARAVEVPLLHVAPTIRPEALRAALSAWDALHSLGEVSRPRITVIDYGLPSITKRMWVFDLASRQLLFHELVAHGRNSGGDLARSFSNEEGSLMTSLGAFVTGTTYNGRHGYSLRLRGMEPGVNDRAEARTIVVHGAPYVSEEVAHKLGRLGRSHGCPAVRPAVARTLIDEVKDRTLLYAWDPSMDKTAASAGGAPTIAVLGRARRPVAPRPLSFLPETSRTTLVLQEGTPPYSYSRFFAQ